MTTETSSDKVIYYEKAIRYFTISAMFWGLVGFSAGLFIACQLIWPAALNIGEHLTFGRLRPVHTSAVIFAFGGSVLFATSFYCVQRTCKAALYGGDKLSMWVFWGYQLFIVLAASGYVMGITQGKEYAEPEWYVDILLTVVWVAYFVIFMGTIIRRQEKHIYVANWFFMAFIITVAVLHIVNNLSMPVEINGWKSYSAFAGVQDAMIQWWYGHNAVGFFLTAGFLGIMYYFVPKQINQPVYSYRLSIIHFWAIIFLYVWAGPHHLHYTALPDWTQTLGMVFSIMLLMPSWGGMINGIMTLSGAWHKLRTDPIIRFMIVSISFYGMSTFEGSMMAIKEVNALSHYTDWTIGHVHSGALGWVAMISFSAMYYLVPRLWGRTRLYSMQLVNLHFWICTIGIVFYITAMWVSGIMQALMWRDYDDNGYLTYTFAESVAEMAPYYMIRAFGGFLFLTGAFIMAYNMWRTIKGDLREEDPVGGEYAKKLEKQSEAQTA